MAALPLDSAEIADLAVRFNAVIAKEAKDIADSAEIPRTMRWPRHCRKPRCDLPRLSPP
jgi:hypothetical protein